MESPRPSEGAPPPPPPPRPSVWFAWHTAVIKPGYRVLDLACGTGRHAIAAAELGAQVVAVDVDTDKLDRARSMADRAGLTVDWVQADLRNYPLPVRAFDIVMMFYYLDRQRTGDILGAVRPGGFFLFETFLNVQRQYGWGPKSDDHLLKHGELLELVDPLEILLEREAHDVADDCPMAVASVLAQRRANDAIP